MQQSAVVPPTILPAHLYALAQWIARPQQASAQQLQQVKQSDSQLAMIYLANQHWLTGALVHGLKQHGVWSALDAITCDYLSELATHYTQRNRQIMAEVALVGQLLREQQIPLIILKGAAALFNGTCDAFCQRYMTDIDILVPEDLQQRAIKILKQAGYRADQQANPIKATGHYHAPPLIRDHGACYVEVHRHAQKNTLHSLLPTAALWQRAMPLKVNDSLLVMQLDPTDQMVLAIVHSELADEGYTQQHIELRQWFASYQLAAQFHDRIDWSSILERFASAGQTKPLYAFLYGMQQLFALPTGLSIPAAELVGSQQQFSQALENACLPEPATAVKGEWRQILAGYSADTMRNVYDCDKPLGVTRARLQHVFRHLKKALGSKT